MRSSRGWRALVPAACAVVFIGVVLLTVRDLSPPSLLIVLAAALALSGVVSWLLSRATSSEPENSPPGPESLTDTKHLLAVLNEMSEGVLVTDAAGLTVFANPQWEQLIAMKGAANPMLGLERRTEIEALVRDTLTTQRSQQTKLHLGPPSPRTLILASSPVSDHGGTVVVAQDVTAFLQLSEMRRDFVANVSHELKTPLSAIRGFAETLADGAVRDEAAASKFLDRILKQCARLEALLSDLLTLSRLEHAADEQLRSTVELDPILDEALDVVRDRLAEKNIELSVERQNIPPFIGHTDALERMCVNLLDNAIKYNKVDGKIEVRVTRNSNETTLEVADTGIGIPNSALERLFERFYRVDKGRSREEGGTGLGLAIVKHAAQLHGGRVEVESELGKGTIFRVVLPLPGAVSSTPIAGL